MAAMLARMAADVAQAFLLGSVPFGFLLYRLRTGGDIRAHGSGNIGATNVMRTGGPWLGGLTLLLDAAKGFGAVVLADLLSYQSVPQPYMYMKTGTNVPEYHYGMIATALVLVVVGHMFTPWLHFRGGRGVATAMGAFLALAPLATWQTLVVFVAVAAVTRYVSLASITAAVVQPLVMLYQYRSGYPPVIYLAATLVSALVILRHADNIARLRAGREHRLFESRAALTDRRA